MLKWSVMAKISLIKVCITLKPFYSEEKGYLVVVWITFLLNILCKITLLVVSFEIQEGKVEGGWEKEGEVERESNKLWKRQHLGLSFF